MGSAIRLFNKIPYERAFEPGMDASGFDHLALVVHPSVEMDGHMERLGGIAGIVAEHTGVEQDLLL